MKKLSIILLGMAAYFWVTECPAATITVNWDGSGNFTTIQARIDAATAGDEVIVADGTYTGDGNRDLDFGGKAITVRSESGPENCSIDCENRGRGFYFHTSETANSIVDGFTIRNGDAKDGGGIYCNGSSPVIRHCTIAANSADSCGGGIFSTCSNISISDCLIENNTALHGAGVFFNGVYCGNIRPSIERCYILNNSSRNSAGGIDCNNSSVRISNCVIARNSSVYAAGIDCRDMSPEIKFCTVADNIAETKGGGIYCWQRSQPLLSHCILWGNQAEEGPEIYLNEDTNLTVEYCDVNNGLYSCYVNPLAVINYSSTNISVDPKFVDLSYLDYHINTMSLCTEAGNPSYLPGSQEFDIDGEQRRMGLRVGLGADEISETAEQPIIGVSNNSIFLKSVENGPDPENARLYIRNLGHETLLWQIYEDCPWLHISSSGGSSTEQANEIILDVDITGLAKGLYSYELAITSLNAVNSPCKVKIDCIVGPSLIHCPTDYNTIQEAIDAAYNSAVIAVGDGIYTGNGNRDIDFRGKAITVRSENGPDNCIIDCENSGMGFYLHNSEGANSIIDGFTINNAHWGGICCRESSPTISNCYISNCNADRGGGIDCRDNSSPTIMGCNITHNAAGIGGGIACRYGSNATINNCAIVGNLGYDGGGGIWCTFSTVTLTNCIVIGNIGTYNGGGISCQESTLTVTNCTFADNSAPEGNFLACLFWHDGPSYIDISNCISWNSGDEILNTNNSTINITFSNIQDGWISEGNIDIDPLFVEPGGGDYHLQLGSVCVDAGTNNPSSGLAVVDLDGNSRVMDGDSDGVAVVDMGAYEFLPPIEADVHIVPRVINRNNHLKRVMSIMRLPEGIAKRDLSDEMFSLFVDSSDGDIIEATWQRVIGGRRNASVFASFDKDELLDAVEQNGRVELTVVGKLGSSQYIYGSDTVRIVQPRRQRGRLRRGR